MCALGSHAGGWTKIAIALEDFLKEVLWNMANIKTLVKSVQHNACSVAKEWLTRIRINVRVT
jgi:hypothetical protein